jgi:hypothetical protein
VPSFKPSHIAVMIGWDVFMMFRDSDDAKIPILLDLVARSSVADFGYLPLVNALVGSLAGATISA